MKKYIASLCAVGMLLMCFSGCALDLSGNVADVSTSTTSRGNDTISADESKNDMPKQNYEEKLLYVTGTSEQIAIRETDEDNAKSLGQLSLGDEVILVSADSVMYYCVLQKSTGTQGYVKKAYLTDEKSAVCKGENCYTSKKTSLFDTKDSDHNEIQTLNTGTAVTVLAKTSGDYWFVNLTNSKTYGYVKCMDLTTSKPSSASSKTSSTSSKDNKFFTGYSNTVPTNYTLYYAKVNTGYLAIRSAKAFDSKNELAKMYTGDRVYVIDTSTGSYWYCYSPVHSIYGYVNSEYLVSSYPGTYNSYSVWTVSVSSGYLALRSSAARANDTNVIGKLYSGNVVYVYSYSYANFTDTYWYVYSPSLDMWGYVDSNYIYS
ncbi:MAG: hypothetical protein IIZ46_01890 [Clostridia bacterium]|nr:hypothetical protein [Clostridia bacterium]